MFGEYTPRENEVVVKKPAIFDTPELKWVAYAETRRTSGGMSGNLSDRPSSMNEEGRRLSGSSLSLEDWIAEEVRDVKLRHRMILGKASLYNIAYPNPVHGTDLFRLESPVISTSINADALARPDADASLVETAGYGSAVTPADCPVLNLVNAMERSTLQIHAGYQGLSKNVVAKVFEEISPRAAANYVAYISPHAKSGFAVHGLVLDSLSTNPVTRDFVYGSGDEYYFNLGEASKQQLIDAGLAEHNIQISTQDSLTDPGFFSHRNRTQKGANGRNGVILGIRAPRY